MTVASPAAGAGAQDHSPSNCYTASITSSITAVTTLVRANVSQVWAQASTRFDALKADAYRRSESLILIEEMAEKWKR